MTHATETERVYYGSDEAVLLAFDRIVAQRGIAESDICETEKLKIYKDTPEWHIRRVGFYFREQAYKDETDGKKRRVTKLSDINYKHIFWQGTLKSDGFLCDKQGAVRIEEKTGFIARPTGVSDLNHPRLRDLFSHITNPLKAFAAVKDKRRTITFAIDPLYPNEQVEISFVQTTFRNGRAFRLFRLEIENVDGKCDPERLNAFMASLENNPSLYRRDFSIADIVYSSHAKSVKKIDALNGRFVNLLSIPGVEIRRSGKYRRASPLAEPIPFAA